MMLSTNTKQKTLGLLVAGLTDRAVATRLGVSERTVQRYVRALMEGAQCRNRMQLGRHAALTGLPVSEPVPAPSGRTPDREGRQLLKALLDDACEEALRSLHMSRRSLERRIKDLMTMAGAQSRVELGWRATLWGWV
ncbi:helix-turn-helix transcriptional regulator [Catenulispora subtropica]|uniref:HTH luxR-type domain-containing protein n=1 Tax=Catenulispora subtropica TaxID=450798 RepID=A0ABN2S3B1_9ACTN